MYVLYSIFWIGYVYSNPSSILISINMVSHFLKKFHNKVIISKEIPVTLMELHYSMHFKILLAKEPL